MPILPELRHLYPDDWPELARAVKERADWRCECTGECGRGHEHLETADGRCRNWHGRPRWRGGRTQCTVILSCAHLDHDPSVRDPERLRAFCEGCHLAHDRQHHAATRRERRERELGLVGLFDLA